MKNSIEYLLIVIALFFMASCNESNNQLQTNLPVFQLDKFEANLVDYITASGKEPVAWAYTISHNGQLERSFASGKAQTADDNNINFTLNKEINIASVTKFYTAIAVMQLLKMNDLDENAIIDDWLPDSWNPGPAINNLSFSDLLKQQSGLQSVNTDFDNTLSYNGIKNCIETGVVKLKTYEYLNVNFALFRILIPSLLKGAIPALNIDIESDADTQYWYRFYMQEYIFNVTGSSNVTCTPEDRSTATLYYHVDDPALNRQGVYYADWNKWCGGGGYFMTAIEMAKVNAYFEHTELLVTKEQRDIMKANRFGMDREDPSREINGSYYGKNGSIGNSDDPSETQGVRTQVVIFPSTGIDCVVVMNCQGVQLKDGASLRQTIYNAYNDAWE
ncbi:serine hydrolase [uncultured Draconibacterium sp.]|uniref:serine hydrolase domain-containing protein n=1 Tax=uncultured Draconibacterium sp. TaxID=1573823 RepID=UPI0025FD4FB4|nr:serine hydrolase [uncultured Draconibacterium sp.]